MSPQETIRGLYDKYPQPESFWHDKRRAKLRGSFQESGTSMAYGWWFFDGPYDFEKRKLHQIDRVILHIQAAAGNLAEILTWLPEGVTHISFARRGKAAKIYKADRLIRLCESLTRSSTG